MCGVFSQIVGRGERALRLISRWALVLTVCLDCAGDAFPLDDGCGEQRQPGIAAGKVSGPRVFTLCSGWRRVVPRDGT